VEVACALGRSVPDVWRDPYALTRYTYLQMQQAAGLREWKAMANRLDMANLVTLAHHAPAMLKEVRDRVWASAQKRPPGLDAARQMQIGMAMSQEIAMIEAAIAEKGGVAWTPAPGMN
jgi:hypothetical protein